MAKFGLGFFGFRGFCCFFLVSPNPALFTLKYHIMNISWFYVFHFTELHIGMFSSVCSPPMFLEAV